MLPQALKFIAWSESTAQMQVWAGAIDATYNHLLRKMLTKKAKASEIFFLSLEIIWDVF